MIHDLQSQLLSFHDLDREVGDEVPFGVDGVIDALGVNLAGTWRGRIRGNSGNQFVF